MRKNILVVIVSTLFGLGMIIATILWLDKLEWYVQLGIYSLISILTIGTLVAWVLKKEELTRSIFLLNILLCGFLIGLIVLKFYGIFESLNDLGKIKELILKSGSWGYLIYAGLNILNVIILPIPSTLLMIAGLAIFGSIRTFIITYISIMIGSTIAFFIGRIFGKKVVTWCIGEESMEKYANVVGKKGNALFVIMQVLPFFPDDILAMLAGLSPMSLTFFFASMLIVKCLYIGIVCFMGSGSIIPFTGWGIPVWITIFVLIVISFILFCKHQEKIESWLGRHFKKDKKRAIDEEKKNNEPIERK